MAPQGPQKTMFAQRSLDLSEVLREMLVGYAITGPTPRTVHIQAPEVESTQGGKLARQSIHLRAKDPSLAPLVAGFIDVGAGTAVLRSYASIESLNRSRNRRPLGLDPAAYEAFLTVLGEQLAEHHIIASVSHEMFEVEASSPRRTPVPTSSPGLGHDVVLLVVGVVIGLCLGAVAWAPFSPLHAAKPAPAAAAE